MITALDLWRHALALSVPPPTGECNQRLAIARLYYATFHAVGQHLAFDTGPPHSHQRLVEHLRQSRDRQHAIAGGRLESLREARVKADYRLGASFAGHEVTSAVHHATAVHKQLGITALLQVGVIAAAPRERGVEGEANGSGSTLSE